MVGLRRTVGACALFFCISLVNRPARGEAVLLDFETDWCGYCRMMDPVVQQLAAEGYNIRKVNGDHEPGLVQKFRVVGYPTFVAVNNGSEVGRISGKVSKAQLCALLDKAGATQRAGGTIRGQSPDNGVSSGRSPSSPQSTPDRQRLDETGSTGEDWEGAGKQAVVPLPGMASNDRLLASSVRIRIQDNEGQSSGSGTIIDARDGEALVLTCGHVFRDFKESGQILVDAFGPNAPKQIPGRLVCYDLNSDVGLIRIQTDHPLVAAKVAPPSYKCRPGETVVSAGCDHGADVTPRVTNIVSVDRYKHAPNLQVAFEPVQGRSGGGLFNRDGYVIGVCNAADAQDKQGLFAAPAAIYAELDRARLTFVYQNDTPLANVGIPQVPDALSAEERALLSELRSAGGSEIICLVRSVADPEAKSRVLQLNRASPAFWRELAETNLPANGHKLTSLESRTDRTHIRTSSDVPRTDASPTALNNAAAPPDSVGRVWPSRQTNR